MADVVTLDSFNLAGGDYDSGSIEISEYRRGLNIQVVFTSLNAATGQLKIQTSNNNSNWDDLNNSLDQLPYSAPSGTSSIMISIDGFVFGQYIKITFSRGTVTTGSLQVFYLKTVTQ